MNLSLKARKTKFLYLLSLILWFVFHTPVTAQQISLPKTSMILPCRNLEISEFLTQQFASDKNNNLYLIKNGSFVHSITSENGEVNWVFDTGGMLLPRIISDKDYLYVFNYVNKKTVNDANVSEVRISVTKPDEIKVNEINKSNEKSDEKSLVFRAISPQSGLPVWKTEVELPYNPNHSGLNKSNPNKNELNDGFATSYLTEMKDSVLFSANSCFGRLNKSDGTVEWKKCIATDSTFGNFVLNSSKNLLSFSDDNHVYLLSAGNGDLKLKVSIKTKISALALIDDSTLVYGDKKGNVKFVETADNKAIWSVKTGGEITGIALNGDDVLISSLDNFIYLLNRNKGRTIWKKRFPGRIKEKPLVNGNIAVILAGDNTAFFVNTMDGKTVYQISLPPDVYFLKSSLFTNDYYFFLTNKGILVYSDGICQKSESGQAQSRSASD